MASVETEALTRRFGRFVAVDALTIAVEAGEVFALLGANGAGKTVTLKMLTNSVAADLRDGACGWF
jgi:ABC-type multidrug transport system ATPase subunit